MKTFLLELSEHRVEAFKAVADWRDYDSVEEWLAAILETAIDHEFDCFYDEHPEYQDKE